MLCSLFLVVCLCVSVLNVFVQCMCDLLYDVVCVWFVAVNVCFVCGLLCDVVLSVVLVCPMLLSVLVCVLECRCVLFVMYCVRLHGVACLLLLLLSCYVCWYANWMKRFLYGLVVL